MKTFIKDNKYVLQTITSGIILLLALMGTKWATNIYITFTWFAFIIMGIAALYLGYLNYKRKQDGLSALNREEKIQILKIYKEHQNYKRWMGIFLVATIIILIGAGWFFTAFLKIITVLFIVGYREMTKEIAQAINKKAMEGQTRYNVDNTRISDAEFEENITELKNNIKRRI